MHPMAREYFERLDEEDVREPLGPRRDCEYYPCHFEGQDCTWCFCPLYPCLDEDLGEWVRSRNGSRVWGCQNCDLVHREEVARLLLREVRRVGEGSILRGAERLEEDEEEKRRVLELIKARRGGRRRSEPR